MGPTYQVVLSPGAQSDIRKVYNYLYENVSPDIADHVLSGIQEEIAGLAKSPEARSLLRGHESETVYRRILKWSYRIIFTVEENELLVLVVRVDHEKMDPTSLQNLP